MVTIIGADPGVTIDDRDRQLADLRQKARKLLRKPLEGDWVDFADGVTRRISYVWSHGVQTSDGGSWYVSTGGNGSFSGGLFRPVNPRSLTVKAKTFRPATFWFFHHDSASAHCAVHVELDVRVWECNVAAPR